MRGYTIPKTNLRNVTVSAAAAGLSTQIADSVATSNLPAKILIVGIGSLLITWLLQGVYNSIVESYINEAS